MPPHLPEYQRVQSAAKRVLDEIPRFIGPTSSERQIVRSCVQLLEKEGVFDTWYYEVPALVLLGSRSRLSVSGRDYLPSDELVGDTNLITIDLSPLVGSFWGDLARSFVVEEGRVTDQPHRAEFRAGIEAQRRLHDRFLAVARPEATFEQVWAELNALIEELGFCNLDFMGNVGHSIVTQRADRVYFEKGNALGLGQVDYFTFEPHISRPSGPWGFKHENIHYFDEAGKARVLSPA